MHTLILNVIREYSFRTNLKFIARLTCYKKLFFLTSRISNTYQCYFSNNQTINYIQPASFQAFMSDALIVMPTLNDSKINTEHYCTASPTNPHSNSAGDRTSYEIIHHGEINREQFHSIDNREQQSISIQQMRIRSLATSITDHRNKFIEIVENWNEHVAYERSEGINDTDLENNFIEIIENRIENVAYERSEGINDTNYQHYSSVDQTLSSLTFKSNEVHYEDDNSLSQPKKKTEIYDNNAYECIVEYATFPLNDENTLYMDIADEEIANTYGDVQEFPAAHQREFSSQAVSPGNFITPVHAEICLGLGSINNR